MQKAFLLITIFMLIALTACGGISAGSSPNFGQPYGESVVVTQFYKCTVNESRGTPIAQATIIVMATSVFPSAFIQTSTKLIPQITLAEIPTGNCNHQNLSNSPTCKYTFLWSLSDVESVVLYQTIDFKLNGIHGESSLTQIILGGRNCT